MTTYQRILLATFARDGDPGPLPAALVGLDDASLADLGSALDPCPEPWQGVGYWPVVEVGPEFDPATETLGEPVMTLDTEAGTTCGRGRCCRMARPRNIEAEPASEAGGSDTGV